MSFTPRPTRPPSSTVPLAWVAVIALVVAGTAIAGTAGYFVLHPTSSGVTSTGSGNGTVTVTDDLGRTVAVPSDPARVAVIGPSIMDEVYRLGLRSHVVAVDCYAASLGGLSDDYTSGQISLWNLSSSMCVQVEPTLAPEMLANLTPDLILASTIVSISQIEQVASQLHIPVVFLQPATLGGILVDDSILGTIFGATSAANRLNAALSLELYNASTLDANTSFPYVLVTFSVDANGYWTFGPGTFGLSLIELAGATSISANSTFQYPELSPATVLAGNPHYIVYGTGFGLNESAYAAGPDWSQFSAVQQGNISGVDSTWITEPDPTMILDGLPALIAVFHPAVP